VISRECLQSLERAAPRIGKRREPSHNGVQMTTRQDLHDVNGDDELSYLAVVIEMPVVPSTANTYLARRLCGHSDQPLTLKSRFGRLGRLREAEGVNVLVVDVEASHQDVFYRAQSACRIGKRNSV